MSRRDPKIFHLLQRAHSALFRASDRALRKEHGIGTTQQAILFALHRRDGTPISELASQLSLRKSSLSGLVDRMEEAGLVQRKRSDEDARSLLLFLEPKGRSCAQQSLPITKRINSQILEPFDSAERAVIIHFLEYIAENSDALIDANIASNSRSQGPQEKDAKT